MKITEYIDKLSSKQVQRITKELQVDRSDGNFLERFLSTALTNDEVVSKEESQKLISMATSTDEESQNLAYMILKQKIGEI